MAARDNSARFVGPGRYILNMMLFLTLVGAIVYYLSPIGPQPTTLLLDAFNANVALNGLILFVLFVGIIYHFGLAGQVSPAVRWIEIARTSFRNRGGRFPRVPGILGATSRIIVDEEGHRRILTPEATRAILDSVGTRIDEGREIGRYIGNLLVFLGLLGTFWGLLQTVNAVADTIAGLASTGGDAEDAVAQLIANLREPLSGMGTAFSSSLFGLGGSLIVGFLDIQAGQAQNRFYSDLEDWLSGETDSSPRGDGVTVTRAAAHADGAPRQTGDFASALQSLEASLAANTEAQIKAQAGQIAELKDEIRALNRTLIRVGGGD